MNDEDTILKELFSVAIGIERRELTTKLKDINSKKISSLINILSEKENKELSIALLANILIINENYEEFVFADSDIMNDIRDKIMSYSKESFKGNKKVIEKVGDLYNFIDKDWMKKYMDLKEVLEVMTSGTFKLCPICQNQIDIYHEKDHFLPKSAFPTLAISRKNIFRICKTCNGGGYKHESIPSFPTLTPILRDTDYSPASNYFYFLPIRKDSTKINCLKTELKDLGLEVGDKSILCEILPKDDVSPYSKIHVNNLINLYKTKKLFNRDEILSIPKEDYILIIQNLKNEGINKDIREIEIKLEEEVNRLITRLQSDISTERYKNFRVAMVNYIHTCIKGTVVIEIFKSKKTK